MGQLAILLLGILIGLQSLAEEQKPDLMTSADLGSLGQSKADVHIPYGDDPLQFVNLYLPEGEGPHPVIIFIHGGCWLSKFDISYTGKLARAFAESGIAVWNIEYRRVGDEGGGWPGTFADVAGASDHLLKIADRYALDTGRVIASGHSAGGHLALWLAARQKFKQGSLFYTSSPVQLKGVLALAAAPDLAMVHESGVCDRVIDRLMGGSPGQQPLRYALGSVSELVPLGIPQRLVSGKYDDAWRPVGERYYDIAKAANDDVSIISAPESGHFEMIDPGSSTWQLVRNAAYDMLNFIPK